VFRQGRPLRAGSTACPRVFSPGFSIGGTTSEVVDYFIGSLFAGQGDQARTGKGDGRLAPADIARGSRSTLAL
jgi:hypothetical protein